MTVSLKKKLKYCNNTDSYTKLLLWVRALVYINICLKKRHSLWQDFSFSYFSSNKLVFR